MAAKDCFGFMSPDATNAKGQQQFAWTLLLTLFLRQAVGRALLGRHRCSAYVPYGKTESAGALPTRIRCGVGHRRKRTQKFSGINCVAATIELAGREPPNFDCSVDCRLGDACGPCCAAWCVHIASRALRKTLLSCSHAVVKDQLSYAAEQRRRASCFSLEW
jgi:hypothetical protein